MYIGLNSLADKEDKFLFTLLLEKEENKVSHPAAEGCANSLAVDWQETLSGLAVVHGSVIEKHHLTHVL